jgi:hypothetical protein
MYEAFNALRRNTAEMGVKLLDAFELMTKNPMAVQTKLLMELLQDNKDTEYGRKHGFADIASIEEYQERVPLTTYDDYEGYIERMTQGGERKLICDSDPVWYNKTSGTVGAPKKIPYTQRTKDWFHRYNLVCQNGRLYRDLGESYFGGRVLNLIRCGGSIVRLPDGVPYGPISEAGVRRYLEKWDEIFPTPKESVFAGKGTDVRYLNARYALCDKDLNNIVCTFTGFLLDFCRYIEKNWELLVRDIENGTIDESVDLPAETREKLVAALEPMPGRAAELRAIFEQGFDTPFMPKVWPALRYVAGGASAGFARYTNEVRERYLGHDIAFYYRGISASEGVFTVPVGLAEHASAFIPDSLFYEFIPLDDEGEEAGMPVTMDRLEVGKMYELVISNHSGLYRYRMRDVLLVVGFHNATPMVEFQYRIDKTVSLMGEKTTEMALRSAAERTAGDCGFLLVDSSVYPDHESLRYVFVMEIDRVPQDLSEEEVCASLERRLAEANPSYGDKVRDGLINPVKILFSQPETYLLYKELMLELGNAIAQLKPVTVIGNETQKNFFFTLVDDFEEVKGQCPQ